MEYDDLKKYTENLKEFEYVKNKSIYKTFHTIEIYLNLKLIMYGMVRKSITEKGQIVLLLENLNLMKSLIKEFF